MEIRKMLKIRQFDTNWTLPSRMEDNPLVWMLEVNGFMMDVRHAPREIQEIAFEKGLIPYIPADREAKSAVASTGNHSDDAEEGSTAGQMFQFKITLNESKPAIWRRIQVQDCTLDKLHEHIQTAMGWTNSHLHQFEIDGQTYGDPELLDDGFMDFECVDSTVTNIRDIVPSDGQRFRFLYEYDFGDGWEHEVLFEGCPQRSPASSIRGVSKANVPVRPKTSAASGVTRSSCKPWPILITNGTTNCSSGVARSIQSPSTPPKQRRRCDRDYQLGGNGAFQTHHGLHGQRLFAMHGGRR